MKPAIDLANEKGPSSWLVLPIAEFVFFLYKGAFQDAVALSYAWNLLNMPRTCLFVCV